MLFELAPTPASDWLTLFEAEGDRAAVKVRMAPVGPSALRAARMALIGNDHPIEAYAMDAGFDTFSRELCRRSVLAWEGIGIPGGGEAELNAETLDQLLQDPGVLSRLQQLYVFPYLEREAEKNASSASSVGTTAGTTAAGDIAPAAAKPAKSAPTSSTPPKRARARPAGK